MKISFLAHKDNHSMFVSRIPNETPFNPTPVPAKLDYLDEPPKDW